MPISNVDTISTKEVDIKNITSRDILDKADPLNYGAIKAMHYNKLAEANRALNARVTLLEAKLNEAIGILNEVVDDIND